MNHIAKLTQDRNDLKEIVANAETEIATLMQYLLSDKFSKPDADYIHIRTDLLPKLQQLRSTLWNEI
jgi:hypothetical protein